MNRRIPGRALCGATTERLKNGSSEASFGFEMCEI